MYSPTPVIRTPVIRTPVIRTPVIRTPVIRTPVIRTPVIRTPVIRTPVIRTPVIRTPVIRTPVIRTPVIRTPVIRTSVIRTSVIRTRSPFKKIVFSLKSQTLRLSSVHCTCAWVSYVHVHVQAMKWPSSGHIRVRPGCTSHANYTVRNAHNTCTSKPIGSRKSCAEKWELKSVTHRHDLLYTLK